MCVRDREGQRERKRHSGTGVGVYVSVEEVLGGGTNQILIKCYSVESHRFSTDRPCSV